MKWRNGIAKATPFPENNLMLFYECRSNAFPFLSPFTDMNKYDVLKIYHSGCH